MKKVWIVTGVVLIVLIVGAGCFWAGMSYGQSRASQDIQGMFQERMAGRGGQLPGGAMTFQERGEGTAQGGGVRGTIEAIEGDTLVVNSDDGIVKVQTTDTTLIEKFMSVEVSDLEVGKMVIVMGSRDDDGTITARSVQSVRAPQPTQRSGGQ